MGLTPHQQRLRDSAAPGVQAVCNRFDEMLKRLRAGESVRHCCAAMGLHREHLKRVVRTDAAMRARYQVALRDGAANRAAFYANQVRPTRARFYSAQRWRLRHLDEVLVLVEEGLSLAEACRSQPGFPTRQQVRDALQRDPARAARYERASRHLRTQPARPLSDGMLEGIIGAVADGALLRDACRDLGILVPAFQYRALREPIWRGRWLEGKATGAATRLSAGTLAYAGEIVRRIEAGSSIRAAVASDPRFPQLSTFKHALGRAPNLRDRVDVALDANRRAHIRLRNLARLAPSDSALGGEVLRRVRAVVPRTDQYDDVVGDMVLAVLSGDLTLEEISAATAKRYVDRSRYDFAPLDKSLGDDSKQTLLDRISTW